MCDDQKESIRGPKGMESDMAVRNPVARPQIIHNVRGTGIQRPISRQGQDRQKFFSTSRSMSFDNGGEEHFGKDPSFNQDDVLAQLTNSDEGISSMDLPDPQQQALRVIPIYNHSASAPSGIHEPLTQARYDQSKNNHTKLCPAKSMVETRKPSQGENNQNPTVYRSISNSKERRQSYKDSAYGGSDGSKGGSSSQASTEVQPSDDVFDSSSNVPVFPQRKGSLKFSELDTLSEDHEEQSLSSCTCGSTESCTSVIRQRTPTEQENTDPSTPRPHSKLCRQQTPDFDVLCPRVVTGSSSSSGSQSSDKTTHSEPPTPLPPGRVESPNKGDIKGVAFTYGSDRTGLRPPLTTTGEVGSVIGSPPRSSISEDDVVFPEYLNHGKRTHSDPGEIISLPAALHSSFSRPQNGLVGTTGEDWVLLPLELNPNSFPSLGLHDTSHKTEAELRSMYWVYRQLCVDQRIRQVLKRGEETPEAIAALILRFGSDSDRSSLSEFSSLSSGTTSISSGLSVGIGHTRQGRDVPDLHAQELSSRRCRHESSKESVGLTVEAKELLEQLERFACCRQRSCSDQDCQQGQRLMRYIEKFLEQSGIHTPCHDNFVLQTIAEHANLCDEIKCPIPWCMFFHENDMPFEEQVAYLQSSYFSGCISLTSEDPWQNDVESLTNCPDVECTEHVHWKGLVRLGSYGNAVLAVTSSLENPAFWVVKKERKDLLLHASVLRRLKKKFHPRIVQHLWILEQEDYIFYASKFEGASLADRLSEASQLELTADRARTYIEQLASAAQFLHRGNINIAYLNWTVENVLLSTNMKFVKLCNFSCAVPIDGIRDDEEKLEDLKFLLPPRIVPPELYAGDNVVTASDVWGLGCLWYHMLTGHMVYPEYRHEDITTIRDKMEECPEPDLSEITDQDVSEILAQCFQMDPCERISSAELYRTIVLLNQPRRDE